MMIVPVDTEQSGCVTDAVAVAGMGGAALMVAEDAAEIQPDKIFLTVIE